MVNHDETAALIEHYARLIMQTTCRGSYYYGNKKVDLTHAAVRLKELIATLPDEESSP